MEFDDEAFVTPDFLEDETPQAQDNPGFDVEPDSVDTPDEGSGEADKKPDYVSKAEYDKLQAQIADMRSSLAARDEQAPRHVFAEPQRQQYQPPAPDPQVVRRNLIDQLNNDFTTKNPGEWALGILETATNLANQAAYNNAAPIAGAQAELTIQNFKSQQRSQNTLFAKAEKKFDKILSTADRNAVSRMGQRELQSALEAAKNAAIGEWYSENYEKASSEGRLKQTRSSPPQYGQSSRSQAPVQRGSKLDPARLSPVDRQVYDYGKKAGWSADEISAAISEDN